MAEPPTPTLEQVYRDHAGFVWRVLRSMGTPNDALDDVVHDVFVVVHRRLGDYHGGAAMTSWLYGIARGVASNHRRGHRRRQQRHRRLEALPTPRSTTDAARLEAAHVVDRVLAGLDPDKREVFVLAELEGMSGPEIADALGLKVDTVYSRLRASRALFKRMVTGSR